MVNNIDLTVLGVRDYNLIEKFMAYKNKKNIFYGPIQDVGLGFVPLKTPLRCPSWGNLIVTGDAAYLANPLNGGGIGPAMKSASLAVETIVNSFQRGDNLIDDLWNYNVRIAQEFGIKYAINDVLKEFLLECKPNEANQFFNALNVKKTYYSSNFFKELSKIDSIRFLAKLVRKPLMYYRMYKLLSKITLLKVIYSKYPLDHRFYKRWYHSVRGI